RHQRDLRFPERSPPLRRLPAQADLQVLGLIHDVRRLDLLPLLQIRLPPHPAALPLLVAVDLLSLFPSFQVAPRAAFAELAFLTKRSAPVQPRLLRHDDTSGKKPRSAPGPPARHGRAGARPPVARAY